MKAVYPKQITGSPTDVTRGEVGPLKSKKHILQLIVLD